MSKSAYLDFFDVTTGKHLMSKKSMRVKYNDLFSPSGRLIVTAEGEDGYRSDSQYKIWEILNPELFKTRFYCRKSFWGSKGC